MSILREEAAREAAERRSEAERTMQVQPDLGLPEAERKPAASPQARKPDPRFADLSVSESDDATEPEPARTRPPSRRALLPDIEEINSTLRPGADHSREDVPAFHEMAERRRGFGAGFLSVIALAGIMALVYGFAPRIAELVPQADAALQAYVNGVDTLRLWLDATLKWAAGALQNLTNEPPAPQN